MRLLILLTFIFYSHSSFSRVRTVEVDDNKMTTITLSLGRSTVLQFLDTPKKVISGNSNYFNIEFSGNDVTIQPLSQVNSNVFIYSGHRRYGFILKTCVSCNYYDDLVKIYWVQPKKIAANTQSKKKKTTTFKTKHFEANKAKIYLNQVFYHKFNDIYVLSGSLTQPKLYKKPLSNQIWATRGGKNLEVLDVIYKKTNSFKRLNHYRFRMFLKLKKASGFTLRARFNGKNGFAVVSRKDLL